MTPLHLFGAGTLIVWALAIFVIVRTEGQSGAAAGWVLASLCWTLVLSVVAVTS